MLDKLNLSLDDLKITFTLFHDSNNHVIGFYASFFNRYPELIQDNLATELGLLFDKMFTPTNDVLKLQANAQRFVHIINSAKFNTVALNYQEALKEEAILYLHGCARVIFDHIFETTNKDYFLVIDNLVNKLNTYFKFDDYIIPWFDYTQEKLEQIDFELSKMEEKDTDQKFLDYFSSLKSKNNNFIHRTSEKLSIEDDFTLQTILSNSYFNSLPEEQNLLPYLINKISKENNHTHFEIHSFIQLNDEYAVNFIFKAQLIDDTLVFGDKNPLFFNLIAKALGSYFSKTQNDSNLFIRAINPKVEIMSYDNQMNKKSHLMNEIYGFFFSKDFSYGLTKNETKKILEHDLYTLQYKKPKPGTFYADASDIFSQYATDKALSLILGNFKIAYHK